MSILVIFLLLILTGIGDSSLSTAAALTSLVMVYRFVSMVCQHDACIIPLLHSAKCLRDEVVADTCMAQVIVYVYKNSHIITQACMIRTGATHNRLQPTYAAQVPMLWSFSMHWSSTNQTSRSIIPYTETIIEQCSCVIPKLDPVRYSDLHAEGNDHLALPFSVSPP